MEENEEFQLKKQTCDPLMINTYYIFHPDIELDVKGMWLVLQSARREINGDIRFLFYTQEQFNEFIQCYIHNPQDRDYQCFCLACAYIMVFEGYYQLAVEALGKDKIHPYAHELAKLNEDYIKRFDKRSNQ